MRVVSLSLRDFRSYEQTRLTLGDGLTVIAGPNGAGKTNLLEAAYFGCTGRSPRTANEREVVRFGAPAARVAVHFEDESGRHEITVGFAAGQPKRLRFDGASIERLLDAPGRPLVSVFLPDRLELIKGPPALRRGHVDQLVAALWPSRVQTRRAYAQALAQRNALIGRIRSGLSSESSLLGWDAQLAGHAVRLMGDRDQAVAAVAERCRRISLELGLQAELLVSYRRRSRAATPEEFAAELRERSAQDVERGFCTHGPHRDELTTRLADRELRAFGSQGQQRVSLLALLLAERDAIAAQRDAPPLMLLDDVLSELDPVRRRALIDLLRSEPGQSVITTTDPDHVPGVDGVDVRWLEVSDGQVLEGSLTGAGEVA
ncbi:MAG TPA: DNA replication and repair protein RecF [Solirubrobacteraceae bacterium]|nr:DNA replication and repair protein RecF [Solirubrobacteraceae bacterium]